MADFALSLVLVCAFVLPVIFFPLALRKHPKAGAALLVVYLGVYLALSSAGRYSVVNHGGQDWRQEWMPRHLIEEYTSPAGRTKARLTMLGAIFWPCVLVDQLVWHRTHATQA